MQVSVRDNNVIKPSGVCLKKKLPKGGCVSLNEAQGSILRTSEKKNARQSGSDPSCS